MKRYRCLSKEYDLGRMLGHVYDANYTWGHGTYNVGQLTQMYPQDWKLIEDDFVLPEKWCIKLTEHNIDILDDWRTDRGLLKYNSNIGYNSNNGYLHTPMMDRRGYNLPDKANGYTEITFDQFKKYVLKQDIMDKKIIGYKLKDDCKQYELAAVAICKSAGSTLIKDFKLVEDKYAFTCESKAKTWLENAKVLDLWFEPVYKEEKKLPKIEEYDGSYDARNNAVKYGCVEFKELYLKAIYNCTQIAKNRTISSVTLNSGVTITITQIKEILDYIDSQK